jgi:hypothetical protein
MGADFGGDGEAGRHRQAKLAHLGQARTLAAQQVLHPAFAFGLAAAEAVDPFRHLPTIPQWPQRAACFTPSYPESVPGWPVQCRLWNSGLLALNA